MNETFTLDELVPHSGEIVLLDEILDMQEDRVRARTVVRADGLFNASEFEVPCFIAVEYMAQAIAAWAGHRSLSQGDSIKPGLLLGTRDFESTNPYLEVGREAVIDVVRVMEMATGLAVFDARVSLDDAEVKTRISVLVLTDENQLPEGIALK